MIPHPIRGNIQVASFNMSSEVGNIVGLGLIFNSLGDVTQVIRTLYSHYDPPQARSRELDISFKERSQAYSFHLSFGLADKRLRIDIEQVNRAILHDLQNALREQPYYFLIFCHALSNGEIKPYHPAEYHIVRDRFILNGHEITGNPSGRWPANPDMFSSL